MRIDKRELLLYAITDGSENLPQKIEKAIKGGVTIVQIREKGIGFSEYVKKIKASAEVCHAYGVKLIVNDDYKSALEGGADGVHLGQNDEDIGKVRKIVGENFVIGATAKTVEQAVKAQNKGADYLGAGAVFPSPTKKNAIRITADDLKNITSAVNIPCVAIGGITGERVSELKNCGVSGIAVVSAIFSANDIEASARELLKIASDTFLQ